MYSYINNPTIIVTPLFAPYDHPRQMLHLRQGPRR